MERVIILYEKAAGPRSDKKGIRFRSPEVRGKIKKWEAPAIFSENRERYRFLRRKT